MSIVRACVVQAGSSLFDTPRTLERMEAHAEAAAKERPDIVVFPEAYVGGYPKGFDFGARVGSRTEAGRDDFLRYWNSAVAVPGPQTQRIGEMAARLGSHLVVGVIERGGATLYCTALFFGPDGTLLGKHRKLQPTGSERLVWGQGDGSTLTVLDTPIGRIGAVICWENYMPMLRQAMYAEGVQLWCAPTVDDRDVWQASMRHVAYEGRAFVLSACQFMTGADVPTAGAGSPAGEGGGVRIDGGSLIASPFGEVLAGPLRGREGVITAELDLGEIVRGKYDLDVAGHYARSDIFHLAVDRRQHSRDV